MIEKAYCNRLHNTINLLHYIFSSLTLFLSLSFAMFLALRYHLSWLHTLFVVLSKCVENVYVRLYEF